MNDEKFKDYLIDLVALLKEQAKEAKLEADHPKEGYSSYNNGYLMAYHSVISLLKHQAFAFCMDQKELGLADIEPERDLLDLHRNPDIDFGEDNWAIDVMNEARVKGYLSESITLLKEQAREAKLEADHPKEGYASYNNGYLMAYHSVISLLKHQAFVFNMDEKEIGLADIEPERDLL